MNVSEEMEKPIDDEVTARKSEENTQYELFDLDDGIRVKTHTELDASFAGHIESIATDKCIVSLITTERMSADAQNLVHSGFIGSAAEYAALVVVNEANGMIFSVSSQYYACARVGDEVRFTAKVRHSDSRKREVDVIAKIESIKIYEAKINIVIPEYHPLKIQLLDIAGANN